ncbi:hypothetical protein [Moraxella lacunata]|uniref:hypothetical protein n=1 Tax=Moraxella lacunata TaxID=477 RepID=UPI003EDEA129
MLIQPILIILEEFFKILFCNINKFIKISISNFLIKLINTIQSCCHTRHSKSN